MFKGGNYDSIYFFPMLVDLWLIHTSELDAKYMSMTENW